MSSNLTDAARSEGGRNRAETWCDVCHSPLLPGTECDFCAAWDEQEMDLDAMTETEWLRRETRRGFGWLDGDKAQ